MYSFIRMLAVAAITNLVSAVLVTKNSPCGVSCGNVLDSTATNDILCRKGDYYSAKGQVWQSCLNCELGSSFSTVVEGQTLTDLQAALYNMRKAFDFCLFNGTLGSNPCTTSTACGPLKAAIEYNGLASNTSAYGYCSIWNSDQVSKCQLCLNSIDGGGRDLLNYISILDGACKKQPIPGTTLALSGTLFTSDFVNVTSPAPTATYTPSGPSGPLSVGAVVGIAFAGVALLLIFAGCCIVINGRRRRRAYLRRREEITKNWPSPQTGGEMFETPVSQRPTHSAWQQESPVDILADQSFPRYFSPYSSQYNSPVSAIEASKKVQWPTEKTINIGLALSPDGDENRANPFWGDKKGKDKDRKETQGNEYELQEGINSGGGHQYPYVPPPAAYNQAPILSHPGFGRQGNTPPGGNTPRRSVSSISNEGGAPESRA